jgi:hypothetical protein
LARAQTRTERIGVGLTAAARRRRARHAAEHRHWRDRLLALWHGADPETLQAGRLWYPNAEQVVSVLAERHHVSRPQVAGVIAALSPQQRWRRNILSADAILRGEPWAAAGYATNRAKAEAIAEGAPALMVLGGDKVRSFWANLYGSRYAVTIDTWMQKAATGTTRMGEQPKGAHYRRIESATISAAAIVGETPREFQAAVWLVIRPDSEYEKDNLTIGAIT